MNPDSSETGYSKLMYWYSNLIVTMIHDDDDDDEQYTFKVNDAPALATFCPHLSSDKMQ